MKNAKSKSWQFLSYLVAVIAAISSEVHGGIALSHEVDREVGVLAEEVADEVARLVLALHLDLHLPLQDHLVLLGVTLDNKLTFEKHIRQMAASLSQEIGIFRKCY